MSAEHWFVTVSRQPINWGTSVVSGKATTDIYEVVTRPRLAVPLLLVWRREGQRVTASDLARAQSRMSSAPVPADGLPSRPAPPPPVGSSAAIHVGPTAPSEPLKGMLWVVIE